MSEAPQVPARLKPAEQEFLNAMAAKMQAGMSYEEAAAAVVADAEAAWLKYQAMRPAEKEAFARGMARIVYHNIQARQSAARFAAAAAEIREDPLA
jgi:ribulose 1,5-bisphosphate carboxylase large subunit-like protein